ncbi:alpha/beta-hydrolase [Pterulicium gracile]|uniref:Alpha/beta-hydrolase n=1 Tax=Pterulicium gracile TaxID=1884261 RepID=A0A5C3QPR0_9AGAR|nr:alpha/beta-hydrolase [Pterula gracilis]
MFPTTTSFFIALTTILHVHVEAAPLPIDIFGSIFGTNEPAASSLVTALTADQVTSKLVRPALLSRVAYCSAAAVKSMTCDGPCEALGGQVEVVHAEGDDQLIPGYYIAIDRSINSVVVAHQGTERKNIVSLLNNADFFLEPLPPARFPNVPAGAEVHDGFLDTFERTADDVLSFVGQALESSGFTDVLVTGHSLGGAIGMLDSLMIREAFPDVKITGTFFGVPRTGNEEFASLIESTFGGSFTTVSNQNDPVPSLPPQLFGYVHANGEVHITKDEGELDGSDGGIVRCEGRENENCSAGNSILDTSLGDHNGPYFLGIGFGGGNCRA